MAIRFIVRPSGITLTPNALKTALVAQQVIPANKPGVTYDPSKDFFFAYPGSDRLAPGAYQGQLASYHQLLSFFHSSKYSQRKAMHQGGLKIPRTLGVNAEIRDLATTRTVFRPYTHMAGVGFEVLDGVPASHQCHGYISELFTRTHEYRVIYVFGERVCTLLKQIPPTLGQEEAWTFGAGATFSDIGDSVNNHRLHRLGFYEAAQAFHVTQQAHICAYDVMINETTYAVSEVNFAPSLKLESRINKVVNRINAVRS